MTILIKNIDYSFIPGDPGIFGTSGSPYIPAYCTFVPGVTVTSAISVGKIQRYVETEDNPLTTGYEGGGYFVWVSEGAGESSSGSSYTLPGITTCYDAVPAVAGVAYEAATPSQIIKYYNEGWNSYASSIASIDNGETFYCTISPDTVGGFIALGKTGKEGNTIGSFSHGVLVDSSGVYVYETGTKVATLAISAIGSAELKISRRTNNSIEYSIGTATYKSLVDFSVADGITAYVYAYLYSGGDSVTDAWFETDLSYFLSGSAELIAASSLSVKDIRAVALLDATSSMSVDTVYAGAVLDASSSLIASGSSSASLNTTSSLFALASVILVSHTTLGALNGACGESAFMTQPTVDLGGLTTEIIESNIIPATPLRILGNLPSIVGTSFLVQIAGTDCTGEFSMPTFVVNASFGIYGELDLSTFLVSGTLLAPTTLSGNLEMPAMEVSGTLNVTSKFIGDLEMPTLKVSGTLLTGTVITGDINFPLLRLDGNIDTESDWVGDINLPAPVVNGLISSDADDSIWVFSRGDSCQQ